VAEKSDIQKLIWHYGNLHDDTVLLVQFCAQRGCSLDEGFKDVCDAISELKAQLAEVIAREAKKVP
jgi:hypothetical protein